MPGVNRQHFDLANTSYYTRYFLDIYDNDKYSNYKFIFLSAIPRFVKSFYNYYGLQWLELPNLDLLYEYPDNILGDLECFNSITRYQAADFFRQVRDNVDYRQDTATFLHASGSYMEYNIQAVQLGKISSDEEVDRAKGCYKVCKDCYKDGFFYRNLCKDMSGLNDNLAQIEELATLCNVHIVHSNLDGLLSYLMLGNYAYDHSEIRNVYSSMYMFCNHCNKSILDNFTWFENDEEMGQRCMHCFISIIWDDGIDDDPYDHFKISHIDLDRRNEYGFPINSMYDRWIKRQKVTRKLSFSDCTEWLNCKKPKFQVERLALLAARAAANVLDE